MVICMMLLTIVWLNCVDVCVISCCVVICVIFLRNVGSYKLFNDLLTDCLLLFPQLSG